MKFGKLLISIVIVSLLVSMVIPMAAAPKGGGGKPPKDPPDPTPANPAIAYISDATSSSLMVMNDDGSNEAEVYRAQTRIYSPSWAPDGSAIAFHDIYTNTEGYYDRKLWRIDVTIVDGVPQGSNPRILYPSISSNPAWSPSPTGTLGDVIAFPEHISDPSTGDITYLLRTVPATGLSEGEEATTLYTAPNGHSIYHITWRSDASQIAFREGVPGSVYTIKVLDLTVPVDSDNPTTVFGPVTYWISNLDWARTKDTIAFGAYEISPDQLNSVWTIDITQDDPDQDPKFVVGGRAGWPSWSPDDSQIAFTRPDKKTGSRLRGWHVWTHDFASGIDTKLAKGFILDWVR